MKYRLIKREIPNDPYDPKTIQIDYIIQQSRLGIWWTYLPESRYQVEDRAIANFKKICAGKIQPKITIMDKKYFAWKNLLQ